MSSMSPLPDGISELLPDHTAALERLRRDLIDLHQRWGYAQVMPPFIEFLETLNADVGPDMDLQTFKLVDQLSGRTLGIRADMTPQVARIVAQHYADRDSVRLCYVGTVLRARADSLAGGSRSPVQCGAELYSRDDVHSDVEIIALLDASLRAFGVQDHYLDIGHLGLLGALVEQAQLDEKRESMVFDILQRKSRPELEAFVADFPSELASDFLALIDLNGDASVIEQARANLQCLSASQRQILDRLAAVVATLSQAAPDLVVHVDLAEFRGYRYHSGVVFAAYRGEDGAEIARGGRYVPASRHSATGFSLDLRQLIGQQPYESTPLFAIDPSHPDAWAEAQRRRSAGQRVVLERFPSSREAILLNHDGQRWLAQ